MKYLLDAIVDRFTAASLGTTITGGIHHNIADDGTAMPYAVYRLVAAPNTQFYGSMGINEPQVDFIVRGVQDDVTLLLCQSLRDAYVNQVLTLTSGRMLNCNLVMDCTPEPEDPIEETQGRDSWGWIVSFRYSVIG